MENKKQLQGNELSFIILIGFCAFVYKISPFVLYWYERLKWYGVFACFLSLLFVIFLFIYQYKVNKKCEKNKTFLLGLDKGKLIFIDEKQRTTHAQVIGTTGSGKTESVILPWIVQDIKNKRGVLIIDGKSDNSFLDKLYSYVVHHGRKKDFKLFSLANIKNSYSFNPLKGTSSLEVAERVFSSFQFENEYYRNVQYKIFLSLVTLVKEKSVPTFKKVHLLLTDMDKLAIAVNASQDSKVKSSLSGLLALPQKEREERISGLESQISHFVFGECHGLFDEERNNISIRRALEKREILYFQLPTMLYPFLGSATGKLVLQNLQSAISKRHLAKKQYGLFSVYLDDFQDYIYSGFGSLLNKSRSANIALIFSHQSIGDLEKVSSSFSDVVLTNTNLKVVMRLNDPKTCDYFAKSFGTESSFKITEQTDRKLLEQTKTGRGSIRKVEEYIFHPNIFKKIPVGHGVICVPEKEGVSHFNLSFPYLKNLRKRRLKVIEKKQKVERKSLKEENHEIDKRANKRRKRDDFS